FILKLQHARLRATVSLHYNESRHLPSLLGGVRVRLIVQIPCYNEVETIGEVIAEIPRRIRGLDEVLVLVVDDGSTDRTVAVALAAGADYVARHAGNRGLAAAFRSGLDAALRLGADVIVNTDGDHQYRGFDIPRLVEPILAGRADLVV